jgi:hypothetical protein
MRNFWRLIGAGLLTPPLMGPQVSLSPSLSGMRFMETFGRSECGALIPTYIDFQSRQR